MIRIQFISIIICFIISRALVYSYPISLIPSGLAILSKEQEQRPQIRYLVTQVIQAQQSRCKIDGIFSSDRILRECFMSEPSDREINNRDSIVVRASLCERYLKLVTELCIGINASNTVVNNSSSETTSNIFNEPPATFLDSILSTFSNEEDLCPALLALDNSTLSEKECKHVCIDDISEKPVPVPLCILLVWAGAERVRLHSTADSRDFLHSKFPQLFKFLIEQKEKHESFEVKPNELISTINVTKSPEVSNAVKSSTVQIKSSSEKIEATAVKSELNTEPKSEANMKIESPSVVTPPPLKSKNETQVVDKSLTLDIDKKESEEKDSIGGKEMEKVEDKIEKPVENVDPDVSLENDGDNEANYPDLPMAVEPRNEDSQRSSGFRDASLTANGNNVYTTSGRFVETEDSHFMEYFLLVCVSIILGYVAFHNKHKLLGLIVEGRRSNSRRRGSGPAYRKLNHTLEEAVNSAPPSHNPNVVY